MPLVHYTPVFSVDNAAITPLLTDPQQVFLATPAAPTAATATTGGTIPAGTQSYRLTATAGGGETLPSTAVTQATTGSTSTVTLTWVAVSGATGYKVYGRTAGAELLIATVGAVTTYIDTGSVTPAGALPTANTSNTAGAATYGTLIALPGIRMASFEPEVLNKELFGDNAIIARYAKTRAISSKVEVAKTSLDVMAVLLGGSVVDAGTTPSQTTTYTISNSDAGKYFRLEYRVLGVELPSAAGGGDLHVVFHKCKITDTGLQTRMEDFAPHTFGVQAIARSSDGKITSLIENESALSIV